MTERKIPRWAGALLVIVVVVGGLLGSCGCAIVRVAVEQGEGNLDANTTGAKVKARIDELDVGGLPLSDSAGE